MKSKWIVQKRKQNVEQNEGMRAKWCLPNFSISKFTLNLFTSDWNGICTGLDQVRRASDSLLALFLTSRKKKLDFVQTKGEWKGKTGNNV